MGQISYLNNAVVKDARIILSEEECVSDMGQRKIAATQDAQIMPLIKECASGMGQSSSDAATQDAQILP